MSENGAKKHSYLVDAYNRMLERFREAMQGGGGPPGTEFGVKMEYAKQRASELGELTREEAERIGDYLQRDIHDAAEYLAESGQEMSDWLKFDLQLAEERIAELFAGAVDTTRLELDAIEQRARQGDWYSGDVTGPGILHCAKCGHQLRIETTAHIPPCPECQGTVFRKEYGSQTGG